MELRPFLADAKVQFRHEMGSWVTPSRRCRQRRLARRLARFEPTWASEQRDERQASAAVQDIRTKMCDSWAISGRPPPKVRLAQCPAMQVARPAAAECMCHRENAPQCNSASAGNATPWTARAARFRRSARRAYGLQSARVSAGVQNCVPARGMLCWEASSTGGTSAHIWPASAD